MLWKKYPPTKKYLLLRNSQRAGGVLSDVNFKFFDSKIEIWWISWKKNQAKLTRHSVYKFTKFPGKIPIKQGIARYKAEIKQREGRTPKRIWFRLISTGHFNEIQASDNNMTVK